MTEVMTIANATGNVPGFLLEDEFTGQSYNYIVQGMATEDDDYGILISANDMGVALYTFTLFPESEYPAENWLAELDVEGYGHMYLLSIAQLDGEGTLARMIEVLKAVNE